MDFLNKAFAQLSDLFKSLSPGARITTGLLLVLVVVSLVYLFNQQVTGPDGYLMGGQGFSADEIQTMEAAFGKAGLSGYELEGNRIRIQSGQRAAYMAALADEGALPGNFGAFLERAVQSTNPLESSRDREERIKVARQQELALIIRSMQGIEKASVIYDIQKKAGFGQGRVITASVSVKPRGTQPLDPHRVPVIRGLVAASIAGLSPDSVTVADLNGPVYSGGDSSGMGAGVDDKYLSRLKGYQDLYGALIRDALSYVHPITVSVNVELDKELRHLESIVKVDPKTVAVSIREENDTETSEGATPAGRPGLEAQQPNAAANLNSTAKGSSTDKKRESSETQNLASHDRTEKEFMGLTPTRVTASVGIPSSYFEEVWRSRNPTPAGQPAPAVDPAALAQIQTEEIAKIRNHVAALIPNPGQSPDPTALVTVTSFPHLASPEIPGPTLSENLLGWMQIHGSTLGIVGLALVSLLMLRSMVRSGGAAAAAESQVIGPISVPSEDSPEAEAAQKPHSPKLKRKLGSGTSLRDELLEMVREDPDTAANILRGWIGSSN